MESERITSQFDTLESLDSFSERATPRPLRAYQLEAGRAIVQSILHGRGKTFTVMMARQSGKNELAAQLEAYLLNVFAERGGQIVKAAPSYRPQIINSILRLKEVLGDRFSNTRWSSRHGHTIELGNARIMFFSADPAANVVGATASLLLAIDEAQDVDQDIFWRSFRPMASTTGATTVLYGTAWDEDNLLEQQRRHNLTHEDATGERLNFEFDWRTLASINPAYDTFVRGEIARLGEDHPTIRTQYFLESVAAAGRLFSAELVEKMHGTHARQLAPIDDSAYVAGIDVAGQVAEVGLESDRRILNTRDETVITIAEVEHADGARLPTIRVVEHVRWKGVTHAEQYERMRGLLHDVWNVQRLSVDATGVGAGLASFLHKAMPTRTDPVAFTSKSKSDLGFALLAAAETGRLTIYQSGGESLREFWSQINATRYRLRGSEELEFSVPSTQGHDDFVMSLALAVRAANAVNPPAYGRLIRARPTPDDLSRW